MNICQLLCVYTLYLFNAIVGPLKVVRVRIIFLCLSDIAVQPSSFQRAS